MSRDDFYLYLSASLLFVDNFFRRFSALDNKAVKVMAWCWTFQFTYLTFLYKLVFPNLPIHM